MSNSDHQPHKRVLLVECNNMNKWVGTTMPYEMHVPPIGLMYLASSARAAHPDIEIRIVESSLDCADDASLTKILDEFKPDIVGLRSIAFFLEELERVAVAVRNWGPVPIIVGGPVVKAYKRRLFEEVAAIDAAVKGEGEEVFARIVGGEPLAQLDGVLHRVDGEIVENPDQAEVANLDSIPFPAYDLIDLDRYEQQLSYAYNHRRQGVLVTSRGCAFHCTYCFSHWRKLRLRSAENIFAEIDMLVTRYNIHDFYVVDDIFNVDIKRAFALFDLIDASVHKIRIYFVNGLRADLVTTEFVDRALKAGAIWFTYAVESAAPEIQKLVDKRLNLNKTRDIVSYTQRHNVAVNISTMYGFPTETREMAQQTLDWIGELPRPSLLPYHFCLRFFPGCEITEQAIEAGWSEERLGLTSRFSYNDMAMATPTLTKHQMNEIQIEYHQRFGMKNPAAVHNAISTLREIGYGEEEIRHMYSVLMRRLISNVEELTPVGAV